ncbi:hypothetical protein NVP1055O_65 [Vibrio phage 1.055.O._10N.286.55.E9]|nr:hypothetical protein NVP1055O_65 [Vibrio phage 1.055.O._10N.286.55.E9]
MQIKPYIHKQAPELCYFTVNGIRYTEKPMLGLQVDWCKVMTSDKAYHPIAAIRKKHFAKGHFAKVCKIEVIFPECHSWLNVTRSCVFKSYSDLLVSIKAYMKRKHPSYYDNKMVLFDGSIMPVPKLKITTSTKYIKFS